eukprot:1845070-Prymnesium_polylepis.1
MPVPSHDVRHRPIPDPSECGADSVGQARGRRRALEEVGLLRHLSMAQGRMRQRAAALPPQATGDRRRRSTAAGPIVARGRWRYVVRRRKASPKKAGAYAVPLTEGGEAMQRRLNRDVDDSLAQEPLAKVIARVISANQLEAGSGERGVARHHPDGLWPPSRRDVPRCRVRRGPTCGQAFGYGALRAQ